MSMSKSKEISESLIFSATVKDMGRKPDHKSIEREAAACILTQETQITQLIKHNGNLGREVKDLERKVHQLSTERDSLNEQLEQVRHDILAELPVLEHLRERFGEVCKERDQASDELISYKVMYEITSDAAEDLSHQLNQARDALRVCVEALQTCVVDFEAVGADGGMSFDDGLVDAAITQAEEILK